MPKLHVFVADDAAHASPFICSASFSLPVDRTQPHLASLMSRRTDSGRSRLKARAVSSRQRNRSRPYGQPPSAAEGKKGVLGRVVDLLTPSFWLSKVRAGPQSGRPQGSETGDRADSGDEREVSDDEETGEQTVSAGRSETSELQSEDKITESFVHGDNHEVVDEERQKRGLEESNRHDQNEETHRKDWKLLNDSPHELKSTSDHHSSGLHGTGYHSSRTATPVSVDVMTATQPDTQIDTPSRVVMKRKRPMFSINSFHSPTSSRLTRSPFQSTFYPGRIMFGGASAARTLSCKRIRQEEDLIEPVRKKMRSKEVVSSQSSLSVHSETAKRILETLDRMSSPLEDVRRIPSSAVSGSVSPLSFTPMSDYPPPISHCQPSFHLLAPPPVEPLVSSHIANTYPTPQQSPEPQEVTDIPSSRLIPLSPPHTTVSVSVVTPEPSVAVGMNSRKAGVSATFGTNTISMTTPTSPYNTVSRGSSAGKMRGERRTAHYRKQSENEEEETVSQPDLPDIPLPLGNLLPTFSLAPVTSVTSDAVSTSITFHFSKPAFKTINCKQHTVASQRDISFHFSHPKSPSTETMPGSSDVGSIVTSQVNVAHLTAASFSELGSWQCDMCQVRNPSEVNNCSACDSLKQHAEKQPSQAETPTSSALLVNSSGGPPLLAAMFVKPNSWTCSACCLSNPSDVAVCKACQTARPNETEKRPSSTTSTPLKGTTIPSSSTMLPAVKISTTSSDGKSLSTLPNTSLQLTAASFRKPNSWQCDVCLISNSSDISKCKACEAPKPGNPTQTTTSVATPSLAAMFTKPNSWQCDTCLLSNPSDVIKCKACEAPKPGVSQTAGTSSATPFFALQSGKVGFWTCNTCLIQNPPDVNQCRACQSVRPDNLSSGSQTKGFDLKATQSGDSNKQQSLSTGFKLTGGLLVKSTPNESFSIGTLSGGFKIPSTGSRDDSLSSGFKLPSATVTSAATAATAGGGFKPSGMSLTGGFVVGKPKVSDGSMEVGGPTPQFVSLGGKTDDCCGSEKEDTVLGDASVGRGLDVVQSKCESRKWGSFWEMTAPSVEVKDQAPASEHRQAVVGTECPTVTGQVTSVQEIKPTVSRPLSIADLAAQGKLTVQSAMREASSKPLTFGLQGSGETKLVIDKPSEGLGAGKECVSEKPHGFQMNAPLGRMIGDTETQVIRPSVSTESVGKGFQLMMPCLPPTSHGLPPVAHTSGLKVQFGGFPSTASQTAKPVGFKLQFSQPVTTSSADSVSASTSSDKQLPGMQGTLDEPASDPKLFSFGKGGISASFGSSPLQLSTTAQNKLFGSVASDQSGMKSMAQSHEGSELGRKSGSVNVTASLSSKLQESGHSGRPTFNFGVKQKSSQEPQSAMFGNTTTSALQTSGMSKGSVASGKPSLSFTLGQNKGPEMAAFRSLGSFASPPTQPLQLFGQQQQNALLGQSSPSTAGQSVPFGFDVLQSAAPFQFGAQNQPPALPSGGSSGLLSNNPFSFPQPGVSSATSDPSVGMEDDTSGALSQHQTTGGYDFSSSLQSSSDFSFAFSGNSSGPPNPFTNRESAMSMPNPSHEGSGRKVKQAVRRLPKKR